MRQYEDKTLGKRRLGDPILSGMVNDALDIPRKLINDGNLSRQALGQRSGYPLDAYMDSVLDIADRVKNFTPKSRGVDRDARFEVTRTRALNAVWGVYQWMQDNADLFEAMGTTSETNAERWARFNAGISLIGYDDWLKHESSDDDDDKEVND